MWRLVFDHFADVRRFGETQAGGDNWMSILTSPRLALRIGLPRCSTGSGRKRCARSPQFSPHSPNAALLTRFNGFFSHSYQLVFFVCSSRREVLRIKGFAKSDLLPGFVPNPVGK